MRKYLATYFLIFSVYACFLVFSCAGDRPLKGFEPGEENPGGTGTVFDFSENAFNHAVANISSEGNTKFSVGNSFFKQNWVIAPSSTPARDGLGPLYNALGCSGCHVKDGRGRPPMPGDGVTGLLFRLSIHGTDANNGPMPHPIYGGQFQDLSVPGVKSEGSFSIDHELIRGTYTDGSSYTLQKPVYSFKGNYGPLDAIRISPRVAPQMPGLGLLATITEADILKNADESDADGDGISGKANYVWDYKNQKAALGRFGWKANQPHLLQQVAGAFNGDIGITSSLFPTDHCTSKQQDCKHTLNGNDSTFNYELSEYVLDRVVFYSATLGVPGRRNVTNDTVLAGKQLFISAGCAKCHIPSFTTGNNPEIPELSNQKIYPYTDLLLHDMGNDLADNRPDYLANGNEWRTPPLWGIGLFQTVNNHTRYLHDGRAGNLEEAILWHGGEAQAAKEHFRKMNAKDRSALITFLNSL